MAADRLRLDGAIARLQRQLLATLGANAQFYKGFEKNALRWYPQAQQRTWFVNHAILHPPVDRNLPSADTSDVYVDVDKETDSGITVSGAKVVARVRR